MNFQQIVLLVASIILIISLIMIGFALSNVNKNVTFPPITASCPDYWENTGNNECTNVQNLGTTSSDCPTIPSKMDFSVSPFTGSESNCEKKKWAKGCGLTWDGITNNKAICGTQATQVVIS